ncbi:YopX family protein [Enterococcus gilvus]|uniref:YopX family protein n=1 Tax=Enterococcus gilvus TaxID=160453 RepID=UPI003EDA7A79
MCECEDGLQNYWYVIEWIFGGWQVVTYKKPESNVRGISDGINQAYLEPEYCSTLKVIGHIHDNPELLKVG